MAYLSIAVQLIPSLAVKQLKRALVLKVYNRQESYAWAHETLAEEQAIMEEFDAAMVDYGHALKLTEHVAGAWRILRKQSNLLGSR